MTNRNNHDGTTQLTKQEFADAIRVSSRTVERYIAAGTVAATKLPGGALRIDVSEVTRLLTPTALS